MFLHVHFILKQFSIHVLSYHIGAVVGLTDIGDINSHLLAFEQSLKDDESKSTPLANSMLVFLVNDNYALLSFSSYLNLCYIH